MEGIVRAWGKILSGYRPNLSIEITRECPLRCPGCYAYGDEHLGGGQTLRTLSDRKGQALIDGIIEVVDRLKPLHVSLVGGEPLVRYRELDVLLPRLSRARTLRAGRDERGAADSDRVGVDSAAADLRLDRRTATRARRAADARHLRSHPQAHRGPADHRALHGDPAADQPRRLHRGIRAHVVGQPERALDLDEPLHAAGR